jgi:hypothetical protein
MRRNPLFNGFNEIKADDELRQRLYAATAQQLGHRKKSKLIPLGALASAAACIAAVAFFATRTPVIPNMPEVINNPTASEQTGVSSANPIALPPPQINAEMFKLHAFSPESNTPTELELDGVKAIIPNMGPDYQTEVIDGKEVEVAGGWICPDFSVSGEDIESVTYTAENELLMYEDPRQFTTEEEIETPILWEKSVTTRPGEYVTYFYTNETFAKMEVKGEYDLTQIRDIIKVEVLFKSGNTKTAYLHVEHDANGVLSVSASEYV